MNKKYKVLFKDTIIFALGNLGSKVILFFLVPLYTNFLSTEEYGIADLVFTTSQLIIPVVSISIYQGIIRFGLTKDQKASEVLKIGIDVAAFSTLLTVLITPLMGLYRPLAPWKWYLCAYVILYFYAEIFKTYLKVKNQNKKFAIISVLQTLTMALMNVLLLAVFHTGIKGYLISSICAVALSTILAATAVDALSDLKEAAFNRELFKEMLVYSAPLIINDLSWWVIHSSDKFMVEAMISASALGLFTVATKIPSLINVMISIFGQAWGISSIREIESSNDMGFYSKVLQGYMFITFGACVALVTIIKPFMNLYVGRDFKTAWVFVPMLLVSAVFSSISSYYGQLYGALKLSVNSMVTTLVAAILNIVINYIFILKYGIWGAVIGTVASYVCIAAMRIWDVARYMPIRINFPRLVANSVIIFVQGILVSMDYHIWIVSAISILLFIAINFETFKELVTTIRTRLIKK